MERAAGDVPRRGIVGLPGTGRHGARLRRVHLAAPGDDTGGGGDLLLRESRNCAGTRMGGGRRGLLGPYHCCCRDRAGSGVPDLEEFGYAATPPSTEAVTDASLALRIESVVAHAGAIV